MKTHNTFFVTTPIYYATAKPHLGSLYSTLLADVLARWQKLCGKEVFFLTGTDEHGQKIAQAAQKAGMEPKEFVDSFIGAYKDMWRRYEIDYTYFVRTTDPSHIKTVQRWLLMLIEKGDVYKAFYHGWYCISCETFVAHDEQAKRLQDTGTAGPLCPTCQRGTVALSEETYFFRLSAYQEKLLAWYKSHPDFILPEERLQEVISFVESGLKDLSISRTTISWGVPFPGDAKHVAYVWADALLNYVSAVGYLQEGKEKEFAKWWPADMQVMGKDIVRFHAVYWPAFLMASGLEIPDHLLVHGWIKVDKEKMSKSRGNVVDPELLLERYGADQVRYYLTREMSIAQDTEFSFEHLEQRITSDLANDLGNLLNRVSVLATKHNAAHIETPTKQLEATRQLLEKQQVLIDEFSSFMDVGQFHMAYSQVWKFIHDLNAYFHGQEPWKSAVNASDLFKEVLAATCYGLYTVALLTWPVMPKKMEQLLESLGTTLPRRRRSILEELKDRPREAFELTVIPLLFQKIEPEKSMNPEIISDKPTPSESSYIDITDFAKVELTVGTIMRCQPVPNSSKLYQLQVDFGPKGMRQILSGVQQLLKPEELIGKQAIFVLNLKPRSMMGLESHGMLLMAGKAFVTVEKPVDNGTVLK
jgi:methionyl-tRNA synthetase